MSDNSENIVYVLTVEFYNVNDWDAAEGYRMVGVFTDKNALDQYLVDNPEPKAEQYDANGVELDWWEHVIYRVTKATLMKKKSSKSALTNKPT